MMEFEQITREDFEAYERVRAGGCYKRKERTEMTTTDKLEDMEQLEQRYQALRRELNDAVLAAERTPEAVRERGLREEYQRLVIEIGALREARTRRAKVDRKVALRAEFDAAQNKRPLRDLVADESVVGSFEGWRFATVTGVMIELRRYQGILSMRGWETWKSLRATGWPEGWIGRSAEFTAYRAADQVSSSFAVDRVVGWKR